MTPHGSLILRATMLVVTALLPITLLAPSGAAAATPAGEYSDRAFKATNVKRSQHDLVRLRKSDCLKQFAAAQARRMAAQRRMFHQDLGPILRRCGLGMVGENVAYGYPTGRAVVNAWMRSPGHRANILRGRYRLMAIAARKGGDSHWYVAQVLGRKG